MKISNHLTSATLSFVILTASAFLPASAQSGPTPQEQMACRSDAGKFCAEHIGKPGKDLPSLFRRDRAGQDTRSDQEHLFLPEHADTVEEVLVRARLLE